MVDRPYPAEGRDQFPEDVSVALVTHNSRRHLPDVVRGILDVGCPTERLWVFDVASDDGSPEWVEETFPGARVVRLRDNLGPNPARNRALETVDTPFVLLMDSDVVLEPGAVRLLRNAFGSQSDVGIASPVVVSHAHPDVIQYAGTSLHVMCEAVNRWKGGNAAERGEAVEEIGCASGNALLIHRDRMAGIPLFDEELFMGKEDGDFTHRVRLAGLRIVEPGAARVRHLGGERGRELFAYQIRNRWYFILKNYQLRTIVAALPLFALHEALQASMLLMGGQGGAYLRAIGGLVRMLPGLPGKRRAVAESRAVPDVEILSTLPLVVRKDVVASPWVARGKAGYEAVVRGYWRLVSPLLRLG